MNEDKVRNRRSYQDFKQLLLWLREGRTEKQILMRFFSSIDSRKGFGSATNAKYADESLKLLIKDMGVN